MGQERATVRMKGGKKEVKGKVGNQKRKEKVIGHAGGREWAAIPLALCYWQASHAFSENKRFCALA